MPPRGCREAKRQQRLAELYASARQMSDNKQWRAVVQVFADIQALDPGYADPDGLLRAAQEQAAALERREALDALYGGAVAGARGGALGRRAARAAGGARQGGGVSRDGRLLERAEGEIARQAEQKRRAQADALYREAAGLVGAGRFKDALARWERLRRQFPGYLDVQGVEARARDGLAAKPKAQPKREPPPPAAPREEPRRGGRRALPRTAILALLGVAVALVALVTAKGWPRNRSIAIPTALPTVQLAVVATIAPSPTFAAAPTATAAATAGGRGDSSHADGDPRRGEDARDAHAAAATRLRPTATRQPAAEPTATPQPTAKPTAAATRQPTATRPAATATPAAGRVVQVSGGGDGRVGPGLQHPGLFRRGYGGGAGAAGGHGGRGEGGRGRGHLVPTGGRRGRQVPVGADGRPWIMTRTEWTYEAPRWSSAMAWPASRGKKSPTLIWF